MATTTNYSWTTPDDTDLVKDGAAAIRTLGSSADTTVKALNPGTTAGDIDYYTTSTAKARVGIGTAGQVLQVNSGATAPEWATPTSGGMTLISTTTLSGATTTLSSIPATYNSLRVVIRLPLPASDGDNLWVRVNGDSGANRHMVIATSAATSGGGVTTFERAEWRIGSSADNAVTNSLFVLDIPDYANTTTWKMANYLLMANDTTTTTSIRVSNGAAFYNQSAAISSLSFLYQSGNATSGTILLYGVK